MSRRLAALIVPFVLVAAACGDGGDDAATEDPVSDFVVQEEDSIDLGDATTTTTEPVDAAGGASESAGQPTFDETTDTIPDGEEEDADGEFFDAVGEFFQCLTAEGFGWLGLPNSDGDPSLPQNDPGYREALGTCAAQTQIVDAMNAAEDSSRFTAEEIEERNRGVAAFVDCLIGRGWTIPPLTPDENGYLLPEYFDLARTWLTPEGDTVLSQEGLSIDDFDDCNDGSIALGGLF
ncbi:MAG: hypothetical protein AAF548_03245 [Actinomycetota bacterium]